MSMRGIVSLSGGLDSAVTLATAISRGVQVKAISFNYGSKHNSYENEAAACIAKHYGVELQIINLQPFMRDLRSSLMLTGDEVPEGHYEAETMRKTVVPGRNLIFMSILASRLESMGGGVLFLGVHAGDHHIYPDCRPQFISCMRTALSLQSEGENMVVLETPFLYHDKSVIIKKGVELGVPFELTRTCYKDQPIACGKCGSCQERIAGFGKANAYDPLPYESRYEYPKT